MEESTSSFNYEEFIKARKFPPTCGLFSANLLEKTITTGKVEGSVKVFVAYSYEDGG